MHPDDLQAPLLAPGDEATLRVRWLGTAGYALTCEGVTLLIDPYLTRASLWQVLRGPLRPDLARIEAAVDRADAIVVGHSHFDHVMDVPVLARRTGAHVYGSRSTAHLMAAAGLPEAQVTACTGGETFEVGPFRVTMVPSLHSKLLLGRSVPYPGDIPCSCELPLDRTGYRCGDVFGVAVHVAGRTLYHMGSANLLDDAIVHRDVDVFLMGIAGRQATERYVARVLDRLRPRVVVPMHYDDFFRAPDAPLRLLPLTRFGRLVDDVAAFDREIAVQTLPLGGEMAVG